MKRKNRDTPGRKIAQAIIAEMQAALKWKVILAKNQINPQNVYGRDND